MKKNGAHSKRILGRRLAHELTREELEQATGGQYATMTLRYPPDLDMNWPQANV